MKAKKPAKKSVVKPARPRGRPRKAAPAPAAEPVEPAAPAAQPVGTTLLCWQCGAEVAADEHVCHECRADLDEDTAKHQAHTNMRCPDCGAHWEPGETVCPECGCSAYDEASEPEEEDLW